MGAKCSCSCFSSASAMGAEASEWICESELLWPRFKRRIKKSKNQSSKPAAFSNYSEEISPTCLISGKSKALVKFVSISREGELIPVILSPVGKEISNERQPTATKTQLGFDGAEIKVKSCDSKISGKSRKLEVCTEEDDVVTMKKSDCRGWVRITKAFRFPKAPAFHGNGPKVSQNPIRRSHKKPMIEQPKAQEIRQKRELANSIPGPIGQLSKSSLTSAGVDSKSRKLWKFINLRRKVSSHATERQGIKSTTLAQLPRPGMNNSTPNVQPKKMNLSAKRKGTITGDATSEGEGYSMAINLSILIIIMACLVLFSNRLLSVVCTSIWCYLLPSLLKKYSVSATGRGVNSGRSDLKKKSQREFNESARLVSGAIQWCDYRKKDCRPGGFCRRFVMVQRPFEYLRNNVIRRFDMYKLVLSNRVSVSLNITRRIFSGWGGMLRAALPSRCSPFQL